MPRTPSAVLVLNGPSSAGKTTIARATRERLGVDCCVVSIDRLFGCVHPSANNDWAMFLALTEATFALASSFARSGFTVVVDTVFERLDCLHVCRRALEPFDSFLVGLDCTETVLREREQQRNDRPRGLAERQRVRVHEGCEYDLRLDTSELSVQQCAAEIAALVTDPRQ